MRLVLVGNYGVGNVGDEALREYFLRAFPEIDWTVLSARPREGREVPRLPFGLRSLLLTPWWKAVAAIWRSDGVVFGGGSLFTDVESVDACYLWGWHVLVARFLRKKVYLAFQGVGPFTTPVGERLGRWAAQKSAFISVRDPLSFGRVTAWNLNNKIVQTFDPVIAILEAKESGVRTNLLIVIPRANSPRNFLDTFFELYTSRTWDAVHVVLLQPDDQVEAAIGREIASKVKDGQEVHIIPARTVDELAAAVVPGATVLTQRYHGGIAGIARGCDVRIAVQGAGDKLDTLNETLKRGLPALLAEVKAGEEALRAAFSA